MGKFYSIIIPLFNRPDEIVDLLDSLIRQTYTRFEVIVIEDGSHRDARKIIAQYANRLDIQYQYIENGGQGFARNAGAELAKGDYFIIFDSDIIVPAHYLKSIDDFLHINPVDAFGGPDAAHSSFTHTQKAISYAMTSFFTTGGIRGRKKHIGQFHLRAFNMGVSKEAYRSTGGFIITRMGEDIELSIRLISKGYKIALIPEAFVYHKRRTRLIQFYNQLHFFGRARINIWRFHPRELKPIHALPAVFVLGIWVWVCLLFLYRPLFYFETIFFALYYILIGIDSSIKNKSIPIGLLSIATSFIQLYAYGMGFLTESASVVWQRIKNNRICVMGIMV